MNRNVCKKLLIYLAIMSFIFPDIFGMYQVYAEEYTTQTSEEVVQPNDGEQSDEPKTSTNQSTAQQTQLTFGWKTSTEKLEKDLTETMSSENWEGILQVKGEVTAEQPSPFCYLLHLGENFTGKISAKNTGTQVKDLGDGRWKITPSVQVGTTTQLKDELTVTIAADTFEQTLSLDKIELDYENNKKIEDTLSLKLSKSESATPASAEKEAKPQTANQDNAKSLQPFADAVANLAISEVYSTNNPYSGENFDLTVRINSAAISESNDSLKNVTVKLTLADVVMLESLPTSNNYTITQENNEVTITFLNDLKIGQMISLPFELKFKEGVSLPTTVLTGAVSVTADNANNAEKMLEEISPKVKDINKMLVVQQDEYAEPTESHSAFIKVITEEIVGGENVTDGLLTLSFPAETEIFGVLFEGKNYPVSKQADGSYQVQIPLGELNVADADRSIELIYQYPYSSTGQEIEYEITAVLTGTRLDGTPINETEKIVEVVPPRGSLGDYSGERFFTKSATNRVLRTEDQALNYTMTLTPRLDLKNVSLVDDPIRNTAEPDFFDGFIYQSFSWSAQKSNDPSITGLISTEAFYQTNLNSSWRSMGASTTAQSIAVADLNLIAGETITLVKYSFSYEGSTEIPKGAGQVMITAFGKTKSGVADRSNSLDDGLTNTLHIYGERKFAGEPASSYEAFVAGEYEDNVDDVSNTHTALTLYRGVGAYPGYSNWEQPFSPQVNELGENFTYRINVNNVLGSGPLNQPVLYITVPTSINIESVKLVQPENNPNAVISVRQVSADMQLVVIDYQDEWSINEWYSDRHGIEIIANGSDKVKGTEVFSNYLVSKDPNQAYEDGITWINIPGVGWTAAAVSLNRRVMFNRSIASDSKKEVSIDGSDFSRVQTVDALSDDTEVTFKLTVPNEGDVAITELHLIDVLPHVNDTLVLSANSKNSSVEGKLQKITLADGSVPGAEYEFLVTDTVNPADNLAELKTLTNDKTAWQTWDGQTALPTSTSALKIIKKDGLKSKEKLELLLHYELSEAPAQTAVLWNSFALSGSYMDGNQQVVMEPGEPAKSGAYVSQTSADRKLAGVVWEDLNANGVREEDEPLLANARVSLYDWNGDFVADFLTGSDGTYQFEQLFEETYQVKIQRPDSAFNLTAYKVGSDARVNNDFLATDDANIGEAWVDLATEEYPLAIDAGYYQAVSIEGYVWYDDDKDGLQTSGEQATADVPVALYRIGSDEKLQLLQTTMTDSAGKYYFTGKNLLPGKYVIKADIPTGYAATIKGDLTATNTSKFNTDGQTDAIQMVSGNNTNWDLGLIQELLTYQTLAGEKTWVDENNQNGKRPDSITVHLFADGVEVAVQEVTADEDGNWHYTFYNYPTVKNGQKIMYTITEGPVTDYETEIVGLDITNTYIGEALTREIAGTKTWEHGTNPIERQPTEITVRLLADGTEVAQKTVSAADDWHYVFNNLPRYQGDEEIVYTIVEDEVTAYETIVSGYNLLNRFKETPDGTTTDSSTTDSSTTDSTTADSNMSAGGKTKPTTKATTAGNASQAQKGTLPKAGERVSSYLLVSGMIVLVAGLLLLVFKRKYVTK